MRDQVISRFLPSPGCDVLGLLCSLLGVAFQLNQEREELRRHVQQLTDQYNLLSPRHDREHGEDNNLVAMMRTDVEKLENERCVEHQSGLNRQFFGV